MGLAEELGWTVYTVGSHNQFGGRVKKGQNYMIIKRLEDPLQDCYPDESIRT